MNRMFLRILSIAFLICGWDLQAQIVFDPAPGFFRMKRELPLVEIITKQAINLSSFGAVPNDGVNDLNAIKNAFQSALQLSTEANPVRLVFEPGTYDIFPPTGEYHTYVLSGLNNLVIEGNQSELIIHNPETGFIHFGNCTNVIVQNLTIDYNKLPFTQGKVTAVDIAQKTFDLTIDKGFPSLAEPYFVNASQKWGMLKEASGKMKDGVDYLFPYYGWTKLSDSTFRVSQPGTGVIGQFKTGDYFVQIARNNGKSIFHTSDCKNITFLNVTVYASPSVVFSGLNNYEWNIINCKVIPKSGRVQSSNADCIHTSGGYLGPWVQGCLFEASSDDGVNMKFMTREITSVISSTKIKVKWELKTNDTLVFYNPRNGIFLGESTVVRAPYVGNSEYEITLSKAVNITVTGPHQSSDKLYVKNRSNESFVYRNTTFKNGRRYGMLLQNSYGVIENCLFENLSNCGLRIENGADWSEGFNANNIVIRNNTFKNCGFDRLYLTDPLAAAITSQITRLKSPCTTGMTWCGVETASWQGLKNITITNNTIIYNKKGFHLENVNGLLLKNNVLVHNSGDISGETPVNEYIANCTLSDPSTGAIPVKQDELFFYPSLVRDHFRISQAVDGIKIFTLTGVPVLEINTPLQKVDVSSLSQGVYLVVAKGVSGKIIIVR